MNPASISLKETYFSSLQRLVQLYNLYYDFPVSTWTVILSIFIQNGAKTSDGRTVASNAHVHYRHRRILWGHPGHVPPIIEKRPCIYQFLLPFAPQYFGLPTQYFCQPYASEYTGRLVLLKFISCTKVYTNESLIILIFPLWPLGFL